MSGAQKWNGVNSWSRLHLLFHVQFFFRPLFGPYDFLQTLRVLYNHVAGCNVVALVRSEIDQLKGAYDIFRSVAVDAVVRSLRDQIGALAEFSAIEWTPYIVAHATAIDRFVIYYQRSPRSTVRSI